MVQFHLQERISLFLLFLSTLTLATGTLRARDPLPFIPPIPRVLPPEGGIILPDELRDGLVTRVNSLTQQIEKLADRDHIADAAVLVKAVRYAIELKEFYSEKEIPRAADLLRLAEERLGELQSESKRSWLKDRGLHARGYRSQIDDSYQPFGIEIPESLDLSRPVPLLIWLHGRGDKATDIHFLNSCRTKSAALGGFFRDQQQAIVLYPFGRQCVGWKHAGEIDVFEAIEAVAADYPIDRDRILLAGFSMGGAGAWHLGAHYHDQFCGVHAGAGFADTKEYNHLTPDQYPPAYEQTLWQLYDVPLYLTNFLNGPLLAYSGSDDGQKATADFMARHFQAIGFTMPHIIAPDTKHRYTAETVVEIRKWLDESWHRGRERPSGQIRWQTPTLRYGKHDWLQLTRLDKHWTGASAELRWDRPAGLIHAKTQGVAAFEINLPGEANPGSIQIEIDGQKLSFTPASTSEEQSTISFVHQDAKWGLGTPGDGGKRPGLQGPIDDAFMDRFVVVPPTRESAQPEVKRWMTFEIDHFRQRWMALMRGPLPVKSADQVTSAEIESSNLILWGDPDTNPLIARIAAKLPITWRENTFTFRGKSYDRGGHVPVLILPNPLNPRRYVVLNSGLTFREGHDRTNSLQNPKLPDWVVIALDQLPDALSPGRIADAGFFDEDWK